MESTRISGSQRELRLYQELLDRAERLRPSGLGFDELRRLGLLYRRHMVTLARLRDRESDPDAVTYLNALSVRAYTLLYGAHSGPSSARADSRRLAEALARGWQPLRVAFALLAMGAILGAALTARDARMLWTIMPNAMGYSPVMLEGLATSESARERFLERAEWGLGAQAFFGSRIFAHNTRIGLMALGVGMLAGIPTVVLTLYNGLILGAFASVFVGGPSALEFLAWILPHGIPEFTAIGLCAAGGLLLGAAVVAPGRRHRRQALREAMETALILSAIAIPLFLAAAVLESFVRESALPTEARLAIAAAGIGLLAAGALALRSLARKDPTGADWLADLRQTMV
jgi:uncharacterized membrane protein SpoIIM required for sporulation